MDIFNQLEQINKSIKQSYCEHDYLLQINDPLVKHLDISDIDKYDNPVRCYDCGKIVECEHEEYENDNGSFYCTLCGKNLDEDFAYNKNPY